MTAIIEDTAEEAEAAMARALCPDENHPGDCAVPWTTIACRFEDLSPDERAAWQADFEAARQQARDVGEAEP